MIDAQDVLDRRALEARRLRPPPDDLPHQQPPEPDEDEAPDDGEVVPGVPLDKFFDESLPEADGPDESLLDEGLDELGPNELDLDPPPPDDAAVM